MSINLLSKRSDSVVSMILETDVFGSFDTELSLYIYTADFFTINDTIISKTGFGQCSNATVLKVAGNSSKIITKTH